MISRSPKRALRIALAVFVGVPGTLMLGSLATIAFYSGIRNAVAALTLAETQGNPLTELGAGAGLALWGFGGVLGFLGFWLWVFAPAAVYSGRTRPLLITIVSFGIIALILFLLKIGSGALSFLYLGLGILSVISGVYIVFDLARDRRLQRMP